MIDTISLFHRGYNGTDFTLNVKEFNSNVSKSGQVNNYTSNFILKEKDKRNIYVKYDLNRTYAIVTFSVPKLLYGNSLENIQVKDKDSIMNILTGRLTGILDADFENWTVSRLDVTKNIEVENSVSTYITALKKAYDVNQGRYLFSNVKDESLTINNNSRRFVIYDKVKEQIAGKELSRNKAKEYGNILRLEVQHKKAKHIHTSFKRKYFFTELFSEESFNDFNKFQLSFFDKFYCKGGQYDLFMFDYGLTELIFAKYSKRDIVKNFFVKKYLYENEIDNSVLKDLFKKYYKSRQGLHKALKQINELAKLGTATVPDVIDEIRYKLVA